MVEAVLLTYRDETTAFRNRFKVGGLGGDNQDWSNLAPIARLYSNRLAPSCQSLQRSPMVVSLSDWKRGLYHPPF